MKNTLLLIISMNVAISYSQPFIDFTKKEVNEYIRKQGAAKVVSESAIGDSVVIFLQKDTVRFSLDKEKIQQSHIVTIKLHFNNTGRCNSETRTYTCDICLAKPLSKILENKKYSWKKVSENKYISIYKKGLMLEYPIDSVLKFRIRKEY